jgi:hypothetical protein
VFCPKAHGAIERAAGPSAINQNAEQKYSSKWIFMDFYGFLWIFMDFYGFLWIFMDFYGFLWIFLI